jgi:hypothetical protein
MPKAATTLKATVQVSSMRGGKVIGIQTGPDEDQMRRALREELTSLLLQPPHTLARFRNPDPVAGALYACGESQRGSTLGFAVNNSGLIICPRTVTPVRIVRHLSSGKQYSARTLSRFSMLQAVSIQQSTFGLIPSYRFWPESNERLFAYDRRGERCHLTAHVLSLTAKVQLTGKREVWIDEAFGTHFEPGQELIGGPVISEAIEVMGIAVAASDRGFLIVQPWSKVEHCIKMNWE